MSGILSLRPMSIGLSVNSPHHRLRSTQPSRPSAAQPRGHGFHWMACTEYTTLISPNAVTGPRAVIFPAWGVDHQGGPQMCCRVNPSARPNQDTPTVPTWWPPVKRTTTDGTSQCLSLAHFCETKCCCSAGSKSISTC